MTLAHETSRPVWIHRFQSLWLIMGHHSIETFPYHWKPVDCSRKRRVARSFGVFFLRLNDMLDNLSSFGVFKTPLRSCDVTVMCSWNKRKPSKCGGNKHINLSRAIPKLCIVLILSGSECIHLNWGVIRYTKSVGKVQWSFHVFNIISVSWSSEVHVI